MSNIYPDLDERLSAELEQYYFSPDAKGRKIDRREKFRVMNALYRLWNFDDRTIRIALIVVKHVVKNIWKLTVVRKWWKNARFCLEKAKNKAENQ